MNDRSKKYKIENHHSVNDGTISARKLNSKFKARDVANHKLDVLWKLEALLKSSGEKVEWLIEDKNG